MVDQIMFARIGWGHEYQGEDLVGNFSEPNESGSWWERFNFKPSVNGLCYGYVPPMGEHHAPPRPRHRYDWLIIFAATKDGRMDGRLLPVGWYEKATIEKDYLERPEKHLTEPYQYIFTVDVNDAYLIPVGKRSSFPVIPTEHFKRCFIYARSPFHRESWRSVYAGVAEKIISQKRRCTPVVDLVSRPS